MPKKIKAPSAQLKLTWYPSKLRVQRGALYWYVRAQQTSALGNTWIVIAEVATEGQALEIAELLTLHQAFSTDGTNFHKDYPL